MLPDVKHFFTRIQTSFLQIKAKKMKSPYKESEREGDSMSV